MKRKLACIFASCLVMVAAALPVSAANDAQGTGFVPSIEQQAAPEVDDSDTALTVDGQEVSAEDLEDLGYHLVLTPLSKANQAPNEEITDDLKGAADDVASAPGTEDMTFGNEEDKAAFEAAKKAAEEEGKALVCTSIFDLSLVSSETGEKADPSNITVTLKVANADDLVLVTHKPDDTWEVVPFINNGDGTITLTLSNLSPFAFFVKGAAAEVVPEVPAITDDSSNTESKPEESGSDTSSSQADSGKDSSKADSSSKAAQNASSAAGTNSGTTTSPDTGVVSSAAFAVPAIIAVGGAVVLLKASRKDKE